MSSGIKVAPDCNAEFEQMKMHKKYQYVVFKISDDQKRIVVDKTGSKDETYDDLRAYLKEASERRECRYAAFDLDFTFNDKDKNKIVFISWNPENAVIKQKMIYTSSKDYIKKSLQMVIELQATDMDELAMENIVERAQRGMKD